MNENPAYQDWLRQRFQAQNSIREGIANLLYGSAFRDEEIQRIEVVWDRDATPAYTIQVIRREE